MKRIKLWVKSGRRFGNGLTFDELSHIEDAAHHSGSEEAATILRLAAALREAMQIQESALALISLVKDHNEQTVSSTHQQNQPTVRHPAITRVSEKK